MAKKWINNVARPSASGLHKSVLVVLKKQFPITLIHQEYPIEIIDEKESKHSLFIDFFIPSLSLAIECHGRQHFERVAFFHNADTDRFAAQKNNDMLKKKWCDMNGITLVILKYNDEISEELVMQKIGESLK